MRTRSTASGLTHYLPLDEDADLAFAIGCVLAGIGAFEDAAAFLRRSLAAYGDDPATQANLLRCERAIAAIASPRDGRRQPSAVAGGGA
jgi:hypothetical protein